MQTCTNPPKIGPECNPLQPRLRLNGHAVTLTSHSEQDLTSCNNGPSGHARGLRGFALLAYQQLTRDARERVRPVPTPRSSNNLGPDGGTALAASLEQLKALKILDIRW